MESSHVLRVASTIVAAAALASTAQAAPTPIPGGANQISAVSGTVGQTVWNGVVRLTVSNFREATPDEVAQYAPGPGQKVLTFTVLVRNGTPKPFIDLIQYSLADKDAINVDVPTSKYTHANLNLVQGAAQRQVALFNVDKDFVPVKMIIVCSTCGDHTAFRPVRLSIPPMQ